MEILLRNGANINEKDVKNISVGETEDFEKERKKAKKEREESGSERELRVGTDRRRKNFSRSFLSPPPSSLYLPQSLISLPLSLPLILVG